MSQIGVKVLHYTPFNSTDFRGKIDRPCLKIWRAAMPIGKEAKGGLVKKELDFGTESYREDIARSNLNLVPIIRQAGWDLLDAQFWFRTVQER